MQCRSGLGVAVVLRPIEFVITQPQVQDNFIESVDFSGW